MSTKSTILNTPWCHVYRDYAYQHNLAVDDGMTEVVVIDCDEAEYEQSSQLNSPLNDCIIVRSDSDFAKMIVWMCEQYKSAHDKVE